MTRTDAVRIALVAVPLVAAIVFGLSYLGAEPQSTGVQPGSLQIVGSETMRGLVTACAEDFMTKNPEADVIVRGGGSGDGVAALLHGIADMGMISRDLSQKERDYAKSKAIELTASGLARDGIAVIVHPSNTFGEIDFDRLKNVYAGTLTKWRDVSDRDGDIIAIARAAGSGTATFFAEHVLGGDMEALAARKLPTNEAIAAAVAKEPNAIGYADLGAIRHAGDQVKTVALRRSQESSALLPTAEAVRSGAYPLTRTLYLVTVGAPSEMALAFIAHCTGPAGQGLIERAGYVGLAAATQ